MNSSDIKFNSRFRMPLKIDEEPKAVSLRISDDLEASEEELQTPYKEKIAKFVNSSATWYPLAIEKIKSEDGEPGKTRLLTIHILSEQDSDAMVFGLAFTVDIDREHQRGMKINGETLEILEYGIGDVAFC